MPKAVPMAASSSASTMTMLRTCLRVPPTARIIPISRVRSSTPMVNVLSMAISEGKARMANKK